MLSIISSRIIALSLLIVSGQDALAQDYDKGLAHRHNGEFQEAYVQFLELAEQGDAGAQFNLGQMYAGGEGGPKDYKAAFKWFLRSAEQGRGPIQGWSQVTLGGMYKRGRGVKKSNLYAYMWYHIATSQGAMFAKVNRDHIAKKMTSAEISEAQKLAAECIKKSYKGC